MDAELLEEIRKTLRDAQFGYTKVDCQVYYKHVAPLLARLEELERQLEEATRD